MFSLLTLNYHLFNALMLLTIFLMDSLTAPGAPRINGKRELGKQLRDWERAPRRGLGVPELSALPPHKSVEAVRLALR